MKRVEISYRTIANEMEKLNARLARLEASYEKKLAKAQKLGVAEWTNADRWAWIATCPKTENGMFLANKKDIEKNGAWFDLQMVTDEIAEYQEKIERTEKRMEKAQDELNAYHEQVANLEDMMKKEELQKLEWEAEQKEWAKDGIKLEGRYYGWTPKGKRFVADPNNGMTFRSHHCWTLRIDGETIFTSGEFWRVYANIKNS